MRILVTGASGGIGEAICRKFLENEHKVVGMDVKETRIEGENYCHIIFDISAEDYPELGEIDALINCAGIMEMSEEDIDINLKSVIRLTEHYAFQKGIKSVLNISSASAITGSEFPHYAAAKGGLNAYTKNLAIRLAESGATANSLCPGAVLTDFNKHILDDKRLFDAVTNESLLKKWANAGEIADWAYFMVCINKSMTGENLLIDNGESLNLHFIW